MHNTAALWKKFYRLLEEQAAQLVDPTTGLMREQYTYVIICPLCGSPSFSERVRKHGFSYVNCRACSFVYVNPQLTSEAIATVYNDKAVRNFFFEELLLPIVERDQEPEFHSRARQLRTMTGASHPSLLDVGCAAGKFLLIAQQYGFSGEGLELNEHYLDYIRSHRTISVQNKTLEEMRYSDESFDIVTLWDVMEHLPKPLQTVQEVARVLRPQGIIAFTTINHRCFNEMVLKDRWRYYMPPDHLCSFTPALLRRLLQQCGFHVVNIQHHYMFEVLADHYFNFLKPAEGFYSNTRLLHKAKKVLYYVLTRGSELLMNTIRSGDILTVYAKKIRHSAKQ